MSNVPAPAAARLLLTNEVLRLILSPHTLSRSRAHSDAQLRDIKRVYNLSTTPTVETQVYRPGAETHDTFAEQHRNSAILPAHVRCQFLFHQPGRLDQLTCTVRRMFNLCFCTSVVNGMAYAMLRIRHAAHAIVNFYRPFPI